MILSREDFLAYVKTHKNRICIPVSMGTDWEFIEVTQSFISSLEGYAANRVESIQFDDLYPDVPEGTIWLNTPYYEDETV